MKEIYDISDDAEENGHTIPDISKIPLRDLVGDEGRVLDAVIRRVVAEVIEDGEPAAGFGSIADDRS